MSSHQPDQREEPSTTQHDQERARQPKGRPTGGQYAEEHKSPSGITLYQSAAAQAGDEAWTSAITRELADALADRGDNDKAV